MRHTEKKPVKKLGKEPLNDKKEVGPKKGQNVINVPTVPVINSKITSYDHHVHTYLNGEFIWIFQRRKVNSRNTNDSQEFALSGSDFVVLMQ